MLNNIGLPGLLLIAVVVLVLFGRGKISSLMGEVGKGITAFKRGVKDGSEDDKLTDGTTADPTRPDPMRPDPVRPDAAASRDVTPEPGTPAGAAPEREKA